MDSRIEVQGGGRKGSVCGCGNGSGRIEVLGNVYIATRIGGGGSLNVAAHWGPLNAEGRGNSSMSINGGR